MNANTKPFLSTKQQIEHLSAKGVTFNVMSKEDAEKYLSQNNNYFKLRAFRKNYNKIPEGKNAGKYIGLDFSALCDLATIDMHLRYCILQLALNTEHFLKVKLLKNCEKNNEDGYVIVTDYFNSLQAKDKKYNTNQYDRLTQELQRNQNNPYCGGIIASCSDGYSIWAFIEVVPLGTLLDFYKFCANRFGNKDMVNDFYLMTSVRHLRNAAAHNNCIINDLQAKDRNYTPDKGMLRSLSFMRRETRDKRLQNVRVLQVCTLLYTHKKLCSEASNKAVKDLLNDLIKRMKRNSDYYKNNNILLGNYSFFNKVIDIFYN